MKRMRPTTRAVLLQLNPPWVVAAVLLCRIGSLPAFNASKPDYRADRFLGHKLLFKDLGDDASANGQATLADRKA